MNYKQIFVKFEKCSAGIHLIFVIMRRAGLSGWIWVSVLILAGGLVMVPDFVLAQGIEKKSQDSLKVEDIIGMSFLDLMNTKVTSASKVSQDVKDVPAAVQVITAAQIKERGYFTLEEALGDLPGFQFRNIVGFNSYVFMRGAPGQNNLILLLVDGVQVNELNSGGFYGGGQYQMSNIDRIEVVYGPASPLYGTNAVSGIINIITKSSKAGVVNTGNGNMRGGHLSLLGGSFMTGLADFQLNGYNKEKDMGFSVAGMYKTSEKADLAGEAGDNNWTDNMENFEHDISLSAKVNLKGFSAGVNYMRKESSMSTYYRSQGDIYRDSGTKWNIAFLNGYVRYSNSDNKNLTYNSSLYYRNTTVLPNTIDRVVRQTQSSPGFQVGYYRPGMLAGTEHQLIWRSIKNLLVTGGVVGEFEMLAANFSQSMSGNELTKPEEPGRPDMLNNNMFSYYLQADWKIAEKLSFVGGARHDFSSYYGNVFTPRGGLVFNAEKFTAKLLYNRAFRAPRPWDYNYGAGNPNLRPEKMHSFELFGSYNFSKGLSAGASIYSNLINDKLILLSSPAGGSWVNEAEVNTFGVEVFGNYTTKSMNLFANYTYTNSFDQDDDYVPEISNHNANAGISYSFGKHFKAGIRANYTGSRRNPQTIPSTNDDLIYSALIFNGTISYNGLKGFDIQLKGTNLLNAKWYHPSNRFAGRYRQPQRTITLMITYNLFK